MQNNIIITNIRAAVKMEAMSEIVIENHLKWNE